MAYLPLNIEGQEQLVRVYVRGVSWNQWCMDAWVNSQHHGEGLGGHREW